MREREPRACVRVRSYSKVDAAEQKKGVVNSGARGKKDRNLRTEVGCRSAVSIIYPTMFKCLAPVIYGAGAPGDFFASGSSLVLPRAAADTRGLQHSTLHCTGASTARYPVRGQQRGAQERRRGGGTREWGNGRKRPLGLVVVRQQDLGCCGGRM
jgi:hypothetical protein